MGRINIENDLKSIVSINKAVSKGLWDWYNEIKDYEQLTLAKSKELYVQMIESDETEKAKKRDRLILGTMYLVFHFVCTSGITAIKSRCYDINDIISTSIMVWIDVLDSGALLRKNVNYFSRFFLRKFYVDVSKHLMGLSNQSSFDGDTSNNGVESKVIEDDENGQLVEKCQINYVFKNNYTLSMISFDVWGSILERFLEFINDGEIVDEKSCYCCVTRLLKEFNIISDLSDGEIYSVYLVFYDLLKILNKNDASRLSVTFLRNLKYFLYEAIVYDRRHVMYECGDFLDSVDLRIATEEWVSKIFKESLTQNERKVIMYRYGFLGEDPKAISEIARELGCSPANVYWIFNRASFKLKVLAREHFGNHI